MSPVVSWLLVLGVFVGAVLIAAGVVALDGREYGAETEGAYPADVEAHIQDALAVANARPDLRSVQS